MEGWEDKNISYRKLLILDKLKGYLILEANGTFLFIEMLNFTTDGLQGTATIMALYLKQLFLHMIQGFLCVCLLT